MRFPNLNLKGGTGKEPKKSQPSLTVIMKWNLAYSTSFLDAGRTLLRFPNLAIRTDLKFSYGAVGMQERGSCTPTARAPFLKGVSQTPFSFFSNPIWESLFKLWLLNLNCVKKCQREHGNKFLKTFLTCKTPFEQFLNSFICILARFWGNY